MATLERLTALDLRQSVTRFRDALRAHQDELNRLNVYPVPDGDTGTNMTLTLESVVHELGTAEDMSEVCQAVAHGSLMGARGNSGVILSQILRGLSDTFRPLDFAGAADLVTGLRQASDAAYEAVMRPVEGTILTVVRAAADAAEAARDAGEQALVGILDSASTAARDAVEHTPDLLPVLARGGGRRCRRSRVHAAARRTARGGRGQAHPGPGHRLHAGLRRGAPRRRRRRVAPLRGDVPARSRGLHHHGVQGDVGCAGRLDRGRGRRRPLELPRAHRRHRRRDRSGHRSRAAAASARDGPARAGRRGAVGAGPGVHAARSPGRAARPSGDHCGGGRRGRRRGEAAADEHGCERGRSRWAVDEPVDRADPRSGRAVPVAVGRRAAQQQEHRPRRAAGRCADGP